MSKHRKLTLFKKDAWSAFSIYIRTRDAIRTTGGLEYANCCTCNKPYPRTGRGCGQAGHFIPGRRGSVLFDERGVNFQCYNCNVNLRGNWIEYERFMLELHGPEVVQELKNNKSQTIILKMQDYLEIEATYKAKIEELLMQYSNKSTIE